MTRRGITIHLDTNRRGSPASCLRKKDNSMLVLSRKETQRIRVGDSIVVTVVKVAGDKVRIGIEAPSDVLVLRDELEAWEAGGATAKLRQSA